MKQKSFPYKSLSVIAVSIFILSTCYFCTTNDEATDLYMSQMEYKNNEKLTICSKSSFKGLKQVRIFNALDNTLLEEINIQSSSTVTQPVSQETANDNCDGFEVATFDLANKGNGLYFIEFNDSKERQFFIQREILKPETDCKIGVVFPNFTWQAYNAYGGASLYSIPPPESGVSVKRPLKNPEKYHRPEATLSFIQVLLQEKKCFVPLSNSGMNANLDWQTLDLIILTGHDEYWTEEMMESITSWVNGGGKLAVFSGNTAWWRLGVHGNLIRREGYWHKTQTPEESLTGLSFRFAGYPIKRRFSEEKTAREAGLSPNVYEQSGGMQVIDANHPIFHATDLKNADWFGKSTDLVAVEVDGIPIDENSHALKTKATMAFPENIQILASGWAHRKNFHHVGMIVDFSLGKGHVVNAGSIGWFQSLENNSVTQKIFTNTIDYLYPENTL